MDGQLRCGAAFVGHWPDGKGYAVLGQRDAGPAGFVYRLYGRYRTRAMAEYRKNQVERSSRPAKAGERSCRT